MADIINIISSVLRSSSPLSALEKTLDCWEKGEHLFSACKASSNSLGSSDTSFAHEGHAHEGHAHEGHAHASPTLNRKGKKPESAPVPPSCAEGAYTKFGGLTPVEVGLGELLFKHLCQLSWPVDEMGGHKLWQMFIGENIEDNEEEGAEEGKGVGEEEEEGEEEETVADGVLGQHRLTKSAHLRVPRV
ncbi:hypothetical protein DACRYDRAFT_109094 [Dacryopinax primogenitus]|uniref:Uncharacterized protein n=1 Tax=Dacryopinax primogenitus (strain DJM 731) TaxID=1858805 RepID=M5FSF9_DACPD|nr:uncharacterized protein DACRYDRAFT_109094 [Dacryopinax primogenitus]EJU00361.1 hypothetical protein DACRYDRAFT_109094 [Dacryopinax primogenitus]